MKTGNATIRITLDNGRPMKVDAFVMGQWAAHPSHPPRAYKADASWCVTHVPTGLKVPARDMASIEAVGLMKALDEHLHILQEELGVGPAGRTLLPAQATKVLREILTSFQVEK